MITLAEYEALKTADWFDPNTWTGRDGARFCFCPGITLAMMRGYKLVPIDSGWKPFKWDNHTDFPLFDVDAQDVAEAFGYATWDDFCYGLREHGEFIMERLKKPEE